MSRKVANCVFADGIVYLNFYNLSDVFFSHGNLPSISTWMDRLKNGRIKTIMATMATERNVGSVITVATMSEAIKISNLKEWITLKIL